MRLGSESVKENTTSGLSNTLMRAVGIADAENPNHRVQAMMDATDDTDTPNPGFILQKVQAPAAPGQIPAQVAGSPKMELRLNDLVVDGPLQISGEETPRAAGDVNLEIRFREINITVGNDCHYKIMVACSLPYKYL